MFADLKLPQADDLLAKAELTAKIIAEIERRRLTQMQVAAILGIDQPKISALRQGKLSGFSTERLMRFLMSLGRDIEITVKGNAKSRSAARLGVALIVCSRGQPASQVNATRRGRSIVVSRDLQSSN